LDLVVDLNYFSFSHPNPTHLPKHEFPSPNNQFSQRIWFVEYHSVHTYATWCEVRNFAWHRIKKFRTGAELVSEKVTPATSDKNMDEFQLDRWL